MTINQRSTLWACCWTVTVEVGGEEISFLSPHLNEQQMVAKGQTFILIGIEKNAVLKNYSWKPSKIPFWD